MTIDTDGKLWVAVYHGGNVLQVDPETGMLHKTPEMKTVDFENSVDPDDAAHNEPPHQDLHCLSSSLSQYDIA